MIDEEKLYFIDTPVEVQEEIYYKTIEYLNGINLDFNSHIYLIFTSISNNSSKFYFKCYLKDKPELVKKPEDNPDFIIFYS